LRKETQPFFGEAFEERRPWAIKREDRRAGFARRSSFGFWICFNSSHRLSPGFAPRLESSVVALPAPLQPGGRQGDISTLPKGDISILLPQPEDRNIEPTAKATAHALEPLVDTGVRIAVRLRPDPDLPVDGSLPGGNDHPPGSRGGLQYRAGPGAAGGPATTGSWTCSTARPWI
jgi:hypothetical protein